MEKNKLYEVVYDPITKEKKMKIHKVILDMGNVFEKKVLNNLSSSERLELSYFFYKRLIFVSVNVKWGIKIITFSFNIKPNDHSLTRVLKGYRKEHVANPLKKLISALRYFLSREKNVSTSEFNFDILVEEGGVAKKIIGNVSSSSFLTQDQKDRLESYPYEFSDELADFLIYFRDGDFSEDDAERKINNKTFLLEKCAICSEKTPTVGFFNCRHICQCTECRKVYKSIICPICRTKSKLAFNLMN